jgi:hypothetical protein
VLAETESGWYHYDRGTGSWLPGQTTSHQGHLRDVTQLPVDIPGLPEGSYTVQFAVDALPNGVLDENAVYWDLIEIMVSP